MGNPAAIGQVAAMPRAFFDSNVWLYVLAGASDPAKRTDARAVMALHTPVATAQVVNEVVNVLIRKAGWDEFRVRTVIDDLHARCEMIDLDQPLQLDASRLRERYGFSPYDGLIVSAALRAGVSILYSEDLHAGLVVRGSLTVVNPFSAGSAPNPAPPGP